jgi:hypothetical protein
MHIFASLHVHLVFWGLTSWSSVWRVGIGDSRVQRLDEIIDGFSLTAVKLY